VTCVMMLGRGLLMNRWMYGLIALTLAVAGCARKPPAAGEAIYDEHADARSDLAAAVSQAEGGKKNIVLIFGANW